MLDRYPAPNANVAFSEETKLQHWRTITDHYAVASMEELGDDTEALTDQLVAIPTPTPAQVRTREKQTGHDVVAFLSVYTQDMPDTLKRHIHRGLTSSDLVDYGHFYAMHTHACDMGLLMEDLMALLESFGMQNTVRVGRTHGQIAAPTSLAHQFRVWSYALSWVTDDMHEIRRKPLIKSPGPTGNPMSTITRHKKVEKTIGGYIVPSTQIIPRTYQLEWAAVYLRLVTVLENLALLVRLGSRSEVDELREGAAMTRVGSSSMPHKRNPIDSEKVCGLARVARGYFSTIAESVAFWEDRDLTNSSVERIVIPDFAATVEHMLVTMINVLNNLQVTPNRALLMKSATWTALAQSLLQEHACLGPIEASEVVRSLDFRPDSHAYVLQQVVYNWLTDNRSTEVAEAWLVAFNWVLESVK